MTTCPSCGFKWTDDGSAPPTDAQMQLRLINALLSVNTTLQRNTGFLERLERKLDSYDRLAAALERMEARMTTEYKGVV